MGRGNIELSDRGLGNGPRALYRRMLVEFGLTPSSRSRVKTSAKPDGDALAEFLARGKGHSSSPPCDG